MTSVQHGTVRYGDNRPRWFDALRIPEVWVSLAISMMWLAVALDAIYGPDFVSTSGSGSTTIPSAIFVALFAWLGSASLAKHALRRDK